MRVKWKLIGRVALAAAALAGAALVWKRDELARLYRVNTLFAEDRIVDNFMHMDRLFWTVPVPRGDGPVRPLPADPRPLPQTFRHDWGEERVEDYLTRSATTALIVLKDGRIAHESYRLGTRPENLRISWSMAKSVTATLIGVALAEGAIDSIDDPADKYAPALAQGAYGGVSIRDLLHMSSGVDFDENYADFNSDINKMGRTLALGGSMDAFAAGQERRVAPAGENFRYVSVDTHALAMALRGATGRSLPQYLSEKLWGPMGAEAEARFVTDGHGAAFALGGLNARARDYARFGLLIAEGGAWNGRRIVPAEWIDAMGRPSAPPPAPGSTERYGYGLHWWIPPDAAPGEMVARGVYGQWIYVNRPERVVIVKTSADRNFMKEDRRANYEAAAFFRAVTAALR
ncbi:serine hydrolase domain-containing protein [Oceanicella actignis]|uniref:serine hydrolase domain-containing protein n=1 Tax=Oceanicella actignis TaxID=1189325 RepID=UPI0011E7974C|nr:serine hydrolase [Oceanicella actignis]TYO88204.1 CubicO group peptidase (beta-lactamase class C family) [Oceanicella actignis]